MDRMSDLEKGGDLSSFAMLLLESSDIAASSSGRGGNVTEMTIDLVPDIVDSRTSSGAKGIKSFFRKRHKSTSSGGESPTACGVHGCNMDDISPTSSAPGSKMRSMFSSSVRNRSKTDLMQFGPLVSPSCGPSQCTTYSIQSEMTFTSNVESESSSDGCRSRGSSDDSGVPPSSNGSSMRLSQSLNVYRTPMMVPKANSNGSQTSARYIRSCSVRDDPPPIGPTEFVEMFRSRTYSDTRILDRARLLERRKQISLSPPPVMSGSWSNIGAFEPRQMIIWKDPQKGTSVFRLPSTDEEDYLSVGPFDHGDEHVFLQFLKTHSCYDVMPTSNKMIVLDTRLNVKKAFYAMVNNGVRVAPMWDTDSQTVTGLFTITDFIKILLKYHRASQLINHAHQMVDTRTIPTVEFEMEDIEDHTIASWNELLSECSVGPLVSVGPDSTMLEAIRALCLHRVHRLPVIDPESGNILHLLTPRRLLHYLYYFFKRYDLPQPSFMEKSIGELSIGTYGTLAVVQMDTPLVKALELFLSYRISSLPVVNRSGHLVAVYAKADVVNLAAEKTYANLTESLGQVIGSKIENCSSLTCRKNESLRTVVDRIVNNELHRVFVLDDGGHVIGVVSLSDILRRLVLSQPEDIGDVDVTGYGGRPANISYE